MLSSLAIRRDKTRPRGTRAVSDADCHIATVFIVRNDCAVAAQLSSHFPASTSSSHWRAACVAADWTAGGAAVAAADGAAGPDAGWGEAEKASSATTREIMASPPLAQSAWRFA